MRFQTKEPCMPRYDPEWLDRMYNNRALVPAHAAHFARWSRESAAVLQQARCLLDLPYGAAAGETLDIFPGSSAQAPVLVFIHGGYWRSLDKADHSFRCPGVHAQGACAWWCRTTHCARP
jgi:arylformamidase